LNQRLKKKEAESMIFSFTPKIFNTGDHRTDTFLAELIVKLCGSGHLIKFSSIEPHIVRDGELNYESKFVTNYFSPATILDIDKYLKILTSKNSYITSLLSTHLTSILVGMGPDEYSPEECIRLITNDSLVLVENEINDWKFIKGVCQKYCSHRKRRSIYQLILKAINTERLKSAHTGGVGEIAKLAENKLNSLTYRGIGPIKLMAIWDSDRRSIADTTPYSEKVAYFKIKERHAVTARDYVYDRNSDLIPWHCLFKRSIENYLPINCLILFQTGLTTAQKVDLLGLTPEQTDYIRYDLATVGMRSGAIKVNFPQYFLNNFSYRDLESRTSHHLIWDAEVGERISEFESILLKLAKLI